MDLHGRTYNDLGNTNADLLLKTRGLVKVQYGGRYIDLVKDGKVCSEQGNIIQTSDSVGSDDGIYIVDKDVVLVSDGQQLSLRNFITEIIKEQESK